MAATSQLFDDSSSSTASPPGSALNISVQMLSSPADHLVDVPEKLIRQPSTSSAGEWLAQQHRSETLENSHDGGD